MKPSAEATAGRIRRTLLAASALLALGAGRAEAARLEPSDVAQVLAQVAREAQARNAPAVIAVLDREGNVLAVMRMPGANGGGAQVRVAFNPHGSNVGINGAYIPDTGAAIAKAFTGAFLSSNGNAFTTRTANQIVQEHFDPGERFQPSGPLYGVQFSSLPCSDLSNRVSNGSVGPQRSPLGLSADPGGFPLYKNGDMVGGVGAIADGVYGADFNFHSITQDLDEVIALAGTVGFEPPANIRADRITAGGHSLRYSNSDTSALWSTNGPQLSLTDFLNAGSTLVPVPDYYTGGLRRGQEFGQPGSGIQLDNTGNFSDLGAFILYDQAGAPRYLPKDGTALPASLKASEVKEIIRQGLMVANHARGQIREPLGSTAQVTVTVVDYDGTILGLARTPDGPNFGIDVAVQKARTAALFSRPDAASILSNTAGATSYLAAARSFLGQGIFANNIAFSARAIGNLARPFYPDGVDGHANGPLSLSLSDTTPFSDGIQLDLVGGGVLQHIYHLEAPGSFADTAASCTPSGSPAGALLSDGIQIFPGGVPIYRGNQLVGGVGVSGDGVDQDDMVAFLGLSNAAGVLNNGVNNAPGFRRADTLGPGGTRLRYVNCPYSPFIDSNDNNVCQGR